MQAGKLLLISLAIVVAIYVAFVLTLFLLGRKQDAPVWAGFIPDCGLFGLKHGLAEFCMVAVRLQRA